METCKLLMKTTDTEPGPGVQVSKRALRPTAPSSDIPSTAGPRRSAAAAAFSSGPVCHTVWKCFGFRQGEVAANFSRAIQHRDENMPPRLSWDLLLISVCVDQFTFNHTGIESAQ